jgi:hypothetical protein
VGVAGGAVNQKIAAALKDEYDLGAKVAPEPPKTTIPGADQRRIEKKHALKSAMASSLRPCAS